MLTPHSVGRTAELPPPIPALTAAAHHCNAHPYFDVSPWFLEHMLIDILSSDGRNGGGVETETGAFDIYYYGWLLYMHIFSPQYFAGKMLVHISVFYFELRLTRWLIYYPAIHETGSNKPKMGTFALRYCGWLLRVHIFSKKYSPPRRSFIFQHFTLSFSSHIHRYSLHWWPKREALKRSWKLSGFNTVAELRTCTYSHPKISPPRYSFWLQYFN